MTLPGDGANGAKRLIGNAILAGTAEALRAALGSSRALASTDLQLSGVVLVGEGDVPEAKIVARAPTWADIELAEIKADFLVLAEPVLQPTVARAALRRAADARLKVLVAEGETIRPLEIDDLVGRPLQAVDWERIRRLIAGRRVLITGGGGSIGSELARRINAVGGAERLTLLDASEYNLYKIHRELPAAEIVLADVRDAASMKRWFGREKPHLVFHTAALKQVPLVEQFPSEGVLTNVCGLKHVADACAGIGADLIFVSTDKAVDPSGVMGASKRLGELYCQALDREYSKSGGPRALALRLGNVLGSAGSVIPIFRRQLAQGGPLTVTDADMTRFFLSIPQAADFLLQAAAIGVGEERARGAAFVIDMGEPITVLDLARKIIRLEGLRPEIDVPITFVGLRPGEKMHERLVASDEWREPDPAPSVIAVASQPRNAAALRETIARLAVLANEGADQQVVAEMFAAVAPLSADATIAAE
ncbi:UDP-N-acetylglucosamine 4,6-dehydratase [alpha proteobacterium U9-1i]|nr:UDP-N-acetylglucosamine 4,6-dehydratase [alpha proteobacterium U9-1i]